MGWTGIYIRRPYKEVELLRAEFCTPYVRKDGSHVESEFEVVSKKGFTYFIVLKRTVRTIHQETPVIERFALIVLTRRYKGTGVYDSSDEFLYKDMDESMGPYTTAPASFLERLWELIPTPPSLSAWKWRRESAIDAVYKGVIRKLKAQWSGNKGDARTVCERANALYAERKSAFAAVSALTEEDFQAAFLSKGVTK